MNSSSNLSLIPIKRMQYGATKFKLGGGGLRIKLSNIGGERWLGPTRKKIFETKPSRMAKNASPRLKFNKFLYRSGKTIDDSQRTIDY